MLDLVVAGGHGPYTMKLYDHPDVEDGTLPFGTLVIVRSTSITGSPQEEKDGGAFLLTFEITDSRGREGLLHLPLARVLAAPGPAGRAHFGREVRRGLPRSGRRPGGCPALHLRARRRSRRARPDDSGGLPEAAQRHGPNYASTHPGIPSEGIYIVESSGYLGGRSASPGELQDLPARVQQSAEELRAPEPWTTLTFNIAVADQLEQDPVYLLPGESFGTTPYPKIADAEQGVAYSLTLEGTGGVPVDGFTDAPHASERVVDGSENTGGYVWDMDWDPDNEGNQPIAHMELDQAKGIFKTVDGRGGPAHPPALPAIEFTVTDAALPTPRPCSRSPRRSACRSVRTGSSSPSPRRRTPSSSSYDNRAQNDTAMTLEGA